MSVIGSSKATWLSGCALLGATASLLEAAAPSVGPPSVAASLMSLPVVKVTICAVPTITQLKTSGNCSNHFMAPPNHFAKWLLALASAA
jgi:hypothetical protein